MNTGAIANVSLALKPIADELDAKLRAIAGERVGFALYVFTDLRGQYISNCDRREVIEQLERLLAHWKTGLPDVPAHQIS